MKNFLKIIAIYLLLPCNPANAQAWQLAYLTDTYETLIHLESIKHNKLVVQYWTLHNHFSQAVIKDKKFFSSLILNEMDCENNKSRILEITSYSQKDRKGDTVFSKEYQTSQWQHIPPESNGYYLSKYLCEINKNHNKNG